VAWSLLDVAGRRICVLAAPGDRRDQDIAEIGRIAAGRFDRYICRRDDKLRGREPDEVPRILRESLIANGVSAEQIRTIPDEQEAIDAALRESEAGDLLLIFGDAITRSWKQIVQFRPDATPERVDRPRVSRPEPVLVGGAMGLEDSRQEFVRDARGVRIAREELEED
jgi:cyanophycin synthetase